MRALLRLWHCTLTRRHDWWAFGVGKPYGWKRCSLCGVRESAEMEGHTYLIRDYPPDAVIAESLARVRAFPLTGVYAEHPEVSDG